MGKRVVWARINLSAWLSKSVRSVYPPGSILNDPKNPTVKGTLLSDTRSFFGNTVLRDSVSLLSSFGNNGCNGFHQFSGEYPPTLGDALDYISKNHIRMVVLLD